MPSQSQTLCLTVSSLDSVFDAIRKKVHSSTTTKGVTATADEIELLKKSVAYLYSQKKKRILQAKGVSALIPLVIFFTTNPVIGVAAGIIALASLATQANLFRTHYANVSGLKRILVPLRGQSKCEEALELAKRHPICKAYREAVIQEGREFQVADLFAMKELVLVANISAREERERAVCQELHGLST